MPRAWCYYYKRKDALKTMKKWSKMHREVCAALLAATLLLSICTGCAAKSGTDDVAQQKQTQTLTQADKNDEAADKTAGKDAADKDAAKEDKSDKKDDSKTAQEAKTEEKKEETKEKTAEELAAEQKAKEEAAKKKAAEEAAKKKAEAETEVKAEAEQKKQQESTSSSGSGSSAGTTTTGSTCTISISCSTILNNMDKCAESKKAFVPSDGVILAATTVSFSTGETVFDVLQRVCQSNGIQMEASLSPTYNSAYIEGIANLYEKDVGGGSGWMYRVNGTFPNYGCSACSLNNGDTIEWLYTCG